jgi:hypothetical protein
MAYHSGSDMAHVGSLLRGLRVEHVMRNADCIADNRSCFLPEQCRVEWLSYSAP